MSRLSRHLYARGTDEYRASSLPADLPAAYASRRFAFARNSRSPTASSKHPLAGPRSPFRFRFLLVLQVGALATSVSDSLRQGSGSGLAPLGAHLRSPGHAGHTGTGRDVAPRSLSPFSFPPVFSRCCSRIARNSGGIPNTFSANSYYLRSAPWKQLPIIDLPRLGIRFPPEIGDIFRSPPARSRHPHSAPEKQLPIIHLVVYLPYEN
jgi:hypothetical protein